jgi:hypothetical protein
MGAAGLTEVERFTVTEDVIAGTLGVLREAGREGYEAFVLWGGKLNDAGTTLDFTSAVRPWQRAQKTPDGLLVTVPSKALFQVNKLLYERGEILAAQVHSHPGPAFHSSTDDAYPLVTLAGALSAVVPDFARAGRAGFRRWVWYRLVSVGRWAQVDPRNLVEVRE